MLVVNGIVFVMLSYPAFLNGILYSVMQYSGNYDLIPNNVYNPLIWKGRCMLYLNSSINPIIYNFMSPRYRNAFRQAFGLSVVGVPDV